MSRLARWGRIHKFWWLFRRACVSAYEDNIVGIAKSAAYSALLSFFPFFATLTALLIQANARSVSSILSNLLFEVVPPGTEEIVRYTFAERGEQPASLPIAAAVLSIWGASGVMMSLMQGFRAAYRIPSGRPFIQERGMAVLLVFAAAVPIVIASGLIVFGSRTEEFVLQRIGVLARGEQLRGWVQLFTYASRYALAFGAIVTGVWALYYFGPNQPKEGHSVWPGAILATALWWITTTAFGYYVRDIADYNVLYGSIGAVIALLVWMYLLSLIALLGCEYNAERERLHNAGLPV